MRAIEIACGVCAQQPQEPCIGPDMLPLRYYHAERISDAVLMPSSEPERVIPDDEWNEVCRRVVGQL